MALDQKQVQKPIRKLRKLLKKFPKQPTPEQIHDLRTNTRRLEATMAAFALDSRRKGKRLLKDLARVRKRSGKVRDMDVLTDDAASLRLHGEEDCRLQLIEHLGAERQKKARKLHAEAVKLGPDLDSGLKTISRSVDQTLCVDDGCDSAEATSRVMASALRLESELQTPRLGRYNLHPYRLKVKELRNVLRLARNDDQEFADTLGQVKDAIGDWHDWEELLGIAKEVLDHGAKCELLRELKRVSEKKYHDALDTAENMRKKYLRVGRTKRKPSEPAKPVWNATRAIAA